MQLPTLVAPVVLATLVIAAARFPHLAAIHPNGDNKVCLGVKDVAHGAAVRVFNCTESPQKWLIERGPTGVFVPGTNLCMTAAFVGDHAPVRIQMCDGAPLQDWFYTGDNRIALRDQGQCLDLPNGNKTSGNPVQTFKCTDKNTNQIWTTTPPVSLDVLDMDTFRVQGAKSSHCS